MKSRFTVDLCVTVAAIGTLSVVSTLGLFSVFSDWSFLSAAVLAAGGSGGAVVVGRVLRLSAPESILLSLIAFILLGGIATSGVPSPDAYRSFADGLVGSWAEVLSSTPPADITAEFRVLPYAIAWFGTLVGGELMRSQRTPGLAALGPVLALGLSLLIALEDRTIALVQGSLIASGAIGLGFVQQRQRTARREVFEDTTIERPKRSASLWSAVVVGCVVAVAAPVLGPRLPLASANDRFDLRDYQEPPFDPLKEPSPLVQIKAALQKENAETVVFRVTSATQINRFPIAILDHYNSEFWAVADGSGDAPGQFRPVDSLFPAPEASTIEGRRQVAATIEIVDYDRIAQGDFDPVWLPTLGWPVSISSSDRLDIRFNSTTGTVALAPEGPGQGLVYELISAVPPDLQDVALREASVTKVEPYDLAAPQLLSLAGDLLEGTDAGWEQVEAIRTWFVDEGSYDSRELSDTGRAGHRLVRLAEFVNDPERIVGFEEQYAATAALLARAEGLPARVVVGYLIEDEDAEDRWAGGSLDVLAEDMSAWIEVRFDGIGWMPFDVTPPRDRTPEETSAGRSQREVAVPNPPPDPPPPVLPPQLDRDAEAEEEESKEEELSEAESGSVGIPVRALVVGVVVTSPVMIMVLGAVLVGVLKRRRTRRRRYASSPSRRVAGAWHEVLDRYEELGMRSHRTATTQEIARWLSASDVVDESQGDLLLKLANDTDEAAYHPRTPSDEHALAAWEKTDALLGRLSQQMPLLIRVRRRLDPRPLLRRDPLIQEAADGR